MAHIKKHVKYWYICNALSDCFRQYKSCYYRDEHQETVHTKGYSQITTDSNDKTLDNRACVYASNRGYVTMLNGKRADCNMCSDGKWQTINQIEKHLYADHGDCMRLYSKDFDPGYGVSMEIVPKIGNDLAIENPREDGFHAGQESYDFPAPNDEQPLMSPGSKQYEKQPQIQSFQSWQLQSSGDGYSQEQRPDDIQYGQQIQPRHESWRPYFPGDEDSQKYRFDNVQYEPQRKTEYQAWQPQIDQMESSSKNSYNPHNSGDYLPGASDGNPDPYPSDHIPDESDTPVTWQSSQQPFEEYELTLCDDCGSQGLIGALIEHWPSCKHHLEKQVDPDAFMEFYYDFGPGPNP